MTFTPQVIQVGHGTVIMKTDTDVNGVVRPSLYIQTIDSYRYQRELTIGKQHRPGDLRQLFWECHSYMHPNFRHVCEVSEGVAERVIARILEVSNKYPSLLFNEVTLAQSGRHEGFVHFHNLLLAGYKPTVAML